MRDAPLLQITNWPRATAVKDGEVNVPRAVLLKRSRKPPINAREGRASVVNWAFEFENTSKLPPIKVRFGTATNVNAGFE